MLADRSAHGDRRCGSASVPRCVRNLRSRQRRVPGRGSFESPGRVADLARPQRAVHGACRSRLRKGEASASDHDRHLVGGTGVDQHGDGCGACSCQPATPPSDQRRHLPTPDRGPRSSADRRFRQPLNDGERRIPAGHPLLGPYHSSGADHPDPPPGARHHARSRRMWSGVHRPASGHRGRGIQLPGCVLRQHSAPHPPTRPRCPGDRCSRASARRSREAAAHRRRRRPLLRCDRGTHGLRRGEGNTGRGDGGRKVHARP